MDSVKAWREKDGRLIHDGDCYFWDRCVCTCGLLHYVKPRAAEFKELMPDIYDQDAAQYVIMDWLLSSEIVKQAREVMDRKDVPITDEEREEMYATFRKSGFKLVDDDQSEEPE